DRGLPAFPTRRSSDLVGDLVSCHVSPPLTGITKICGLPSTEARKARRVPSGDQRAWLSPRRPRSSTRWTRVEMSISTSSGSYRRSEEHTSELQSPDHL